jgi:hypothetical protein
MQKARKLLRFRQKKHQQVPLHNGDAITMPVNAESQQRMDTSDAEPRKADLPSFELLLNSDTLSAIFIACAALDWRSPAIIAAVCRFWREIVLATPRAWQYFRNLDNSLDLGESDMVLWISRCGILPLHMHLSKGSRGPRQENVLEFRHRFECLTIQHAFDSVGFDYPGLKYLALFDDFWFEPLRNENSEGPRAEWNVVEAVSMLTRTRYPLLQSLSVMSRTRTYDGFDLKPNFPRLQKLDLKVRGLANWGSVLYHCSDTLVSLTFEGYAEYSSPSAIGKIEVLDLPKLRHLSLNHYWARSCPTPFIFATPLLEVFETIHSFWAHGARSFVNTNNVTSLIYQDLRPLDPTLFPAVQQLFVCGTAEGLDSICNTLSGGEDLCPMLSLIAYKVLETKYNLLSMQRLATQRNLKAIPIQEPGQWRKLTFDIVPKLTVCSIRYHRLF